MKFKDLKATNGWQDNGTGVLYQVAQHPIDQVCWYTRCPWPSPPMQGPEGQGAGCRAGRPVHPSKPLIPCSEAVETWAVKNYQSLSRTSNTRLCSCENRTLSTTPWRPTFQPSWLLDYRFLIKKHWYTYASYSVCFYFYCSVEAARGHLICLIYDRP